MPASTNSLFAECLVRESSGQPWTTRVRIPFQPSRQDRHRGTKIRGHYFDDFIDGSSGTRARKGYSPIQKGEFNVEIAGDVNTYLQELLTNRFYHFNADNPVKRVFPFFG